MGAKAINGLIYRWPDNSFVNASFWCKNIVRNPVQCVVMNVALECLLTSPCYSQYDILCSSKPIKLINWHNQLCRVPTTWDYETIELLFRTLNFENKTFPLVLKWIRAVSSSFLLTRCWACKRLSWQIWINEDRTGSIGSLGGLRSFGSDHWFRLVNFSLQIIDREIFRPSRKQIVSN